MDYQEYRDLAPRSDIENGQEYINALEWAFGNTKIKNIALAGPYGAGKSSIIETYIQHKEKGSNSTGRHRSGKRTPETYLKISMATFVEEQLKTNVGANAETNKIIDISADEVEQGILKQLFYKVKPERIPQSRYRKLHVANSQMIFWKAFAAQSLLVILMELFAPQAQDFLFGSIVRFSTAHPIPWLSPVIQCITTTLLSWSLTAYFASRCWFLFSDRYHIKSITLPADARIETDCNFSDSVFDKNLDEIMYFFEVTPYRTIFFEDLDRLSDRKIFIHLRELNNLLNNDDAIKGKPIVFVYAVKDDIFTKEDRTKFFDFIIPVIPVINSTNSGEILLARLDESKKNGIKHNISKPFVLDVAPYISDMRVLQNIYNEFVLYKNTLKVSQKLPLSDKHMMSMIIFKNLYPRDFSDIQSEKGILKRAFENKESYIRNKKGELQNDINNITMVIKNAEHDHLKNTQELKAAMLVGLTDNEGFPLYFQNNYSNEVSLSQIMNPEYDMNQLEKLRINSLHCIGYDGRTNNSSISNFQEKIAAYLKRWNDIKALENEGLKNLQNRIANAKHTQHVLSGKTIKEILSEHKDFHLDEDVAQNKLLVFMLRRGYINEEYPIYINYFKGKSITNDDMQFILSVKNREPKPFNYHLTKTATIIQRLQEHEFEQKEIYNFDLLEQLLSDEKEHVKREVFIQQLSDESEKSWNFIDEFFDRTRHRNNFIRLLSSAWPRMWTHIAKTTTLQYERQLQYLSLLIETLDESALEKLNTNDAIKDFIEEHEDILKKLSSSTSHEALCAVLGKLNVSFGIQGTDGVPNEVLDYVFDHCLYQLNEKMIFNLVSYKNDAMSANLETQPYTTIADLNYAKLIEYVDRDFLTYIDNNIKTKGTLKDREDLVRDMVSKAMPEQEYCTTIIKIEQFQTPDITQFFTESIKDNQKLVQAIWDALLQYNRIEPTWENLMSYRAHFPLGKVLIEYITQHTEELKTNNTSCCTDKFIKELIDANLEPGVYEQLLSILRMKDFNLDLDKLTENMIALMIEINYFDFSVTKFSHLYKKHHDLAINYIVKNQEEFLAQIENINMSSQLLNELLANDSITDKTKDTLFKSCAEEHMSADIVNFIIGKQIKIPQKSCFKAAWKYANESQRERIFMGNLELLHIDDLEQCFSDLGDKYSNFIRRTSRHDAELPESEENLKLARYLKETDYITSYETIDREPHDTQSGKIPKVKMIKYRIKQKK